MKPTDLFFSFRNSRERPPEVVGHRYSKIGTPEGVSWALSLRGRMASAKVPFLCFGGTLLGVARDGALIPWDDDLDFLVPRTWLLSQESSRFFGQLVNDGFDVSRKGFPMFPSANVTSEGYKATFSSLRISGKQYLRPIYSIPRKLLSDRDFQTPLLLDAHGINWPVPRQYAGILIHVYGDWQHAVDWDGGAFYNPTYFNGRGKRLVLNIWMRIFGIVFAHRSTRTISQRRVPRDL